MSGELREGGQPETILNTTLPGCERSSDGSQKLTMHNQQGQEVLLYTVTPAGDDSSDVIIEIKCVPGKKTYEAENYERFFKQTGRGIIVKETTPAIVRIPVTEFKHLKFLFESLADRAARLEPRIPLNPSYIIQEGTITT